MLSLIKDFLDLSQFETRSLLINKEPTSIQNILIECVEMLNFMASQKGIKLDIAECQGSLCENKPPLLTDGNRVKQIIVNLVSNAIKYTQKGYVKVRPELSEDHNYLNLNVEDTGVGIEPDKMQNLFQAFTKIKKNRQMNKEGVGLGLMISKNLAIALGGDLIAESVLGKGSKFTLRLPLAIYDPSFDYSDSGQVLSNVEDSQKPLSQIMIFHETGDY